ncbi:MAG TPA: ATP-binding protein [Thermoanaerobaculia bacterium]|nr:ATP-binding protein [Thermoanaerobaculia bacterium]
MTSRPHIRLLMLEDNPRDAELTERILRRELELSLTVVDDEPSFRNALLTSDPDVILSDYTMPQFDGMSALRITRVLAPDTPFIFLSGSIGEERAIEALREGATDYVLKDRTSRLSSAIVRALAERRERILRQNMEKALRASEQRFQYAAAATREIIWDWDIVTSKIWFGDALRNYWGYDALPSETDATWLLNRIHPEDREAVMTSFRQAVASKERWHTEFRLARADDTYTNVIARGVVVRDAAGTAMRVIGATFDITEQLQLRQQLEQASRVESLGRVAATVAHEFNNVLMCLSPVSEFLRRGPTPQLIDQAATRIAESVSRGRRLTEQILRFGRPADPVFATVDLVEWLGALMPDIRALAGSAVSILPTVRKAPLPVSIDSDQLKQVLTNLIANARDAMSKGGTIRITADEEGSCACLIVADTGTGIPAHVLHRIFEPLYTTKRSGTGLGLAVAQQIIVQHRGSIDVTSTPGEGTSIRVRLPLAL